jgi:hypothetical protein
MIGRVKKRARGLPPQRGGIEGGEKRPPHAVPLMRLHAGHPTLDPSPEGRESAACMPPQFKSNREGVAHDQRA